MNKKFTVLTFSLRATERGATSSGSSLDAVQTCDKGAEMLLSSTNFTSLGDSLFSGREEVLEAAKLTSVMRSNITNLFDEVRLLKPQQQFKNVKLSLEGCNGDFEIDHILICKSSKVKAGQVEGDDVLFVFFLRTIFEGQHNSKAVELNERFATATDLFYSYRLCLRAERLAIALDVNGDWDEEYRKPILARKKLAVGRKYALLKNRAMPDSFVLPVFAGISRIYRLDVQLDNLSGLLDELSKTLETQNSYVFVMCNMMRQPPYIEPITGD